MLQTALVILLVAASVLYLVNKLRNSFRKEPGCSNCASAPDRA